MAPTPDELIDSLKGTVDKLEARVAELESRLKGKDGGSSSSGSTSGGSNLRMILIGPPGAGKPRFISSLSESIETSPCTKTI